MSLSLRIVLRSGLAIPACRFLRIRRDCNAVLIKALLVKETKSGFRSAVALPRGFPQPHETLLRVLCDSVAFEISLGQVVLGFRISGLGSVQQIGDTLSVDQLNMGEH